MDNCAPASVSAIVEYDYTANETDELDLVKGAILNNIKVQPGGWWEGTLASTGKTGMFPDNFVRILDADERSPVVLRDKSATIHRKCKVIYSYTQHNEDELSLAVGNIIEILGEVEEGWWRGKLGEKIGVFPSNFVVPIETSPILANKRPNSTKKENNRSLHSSREDLLSTSPSHLDKDAPILPPKPIREYCRVLFPYDPQNEDELELQIGEIITIISKDLPDKGWWRGELRGKVGVFPDNFVKLLPPEVSPSKESHSDKPPSQSSKVFLKKSGSGSSSQGSNRKDSFGSRDSLNDILSETGIISGNVAAQRKSLENKKIDLTSTDAKVRRSLEAKTNEMRKSLETMDDKKTPPPVLTKKPIVPVKKSTTVTSVAGSVLSGLKNKIKSVEQKMTSHDSMDGIGNSRLASQIADNNEKGIVGEKLKKDDLDFDHVERGSMLQDMRAGRAKAPKRRPPSAAINVIGESNNNDSIFVNGGGAYVDFAHSDSLNESMNSDELAKPKPREWEKKKAPWMAELKASQAKKTSPNVEPRAVERVKIDPEVNNKEMTRSVNNTSYSTTSQRKSMETTASSNATHEIRASSFDSIKKEPNELAKSMSSIVSTKVPVAVVNENTITIDDIKSRPTSLSILNRSVSPIGRTSLGKTTTTTTTTILGSTTIIEPAKSNSTSQPVSHENVCARVSELEERVQKLESTIHTQNKIIEELVRSFKEETDKVKGLKTELDKYAQCVTQV